ncbi:MULTISPECIES: hypothetical protein [unclassified Tenacibaculum]|uniref:hypothetical protein n=1 Tax=unclassified Tenacibaculum TaxID=2635139 RepID=UPI001F17EB4A|nr:MULTISPECIES: hypothetical protein [unclassified Tenacibaculum]MCF2874035.1 hypothetical protein [Tenacibaculum sp. Cn5-1]MCF2934616.1 hypothetical protein [Tenacibaculum sp. Cn5-34]MCG7510826.1 hypothetical protein [Tenacibaculum sp. Cn5-46]
MAKQKTKKVESYRKIELLNIPEKTTGAYISVYTGGKLAQNAAWNTKGKYEIKISDCERSILLHGSITSLESRKNAIHKIDSLVEVLSGLKDHLVMQFKENNVRF